MFSVKELTLVAILSCLVWQINGQTDAGGGGAGGGGGSGSTLPTTTLPTTTLPTTTPAAGQCPSQYCLNGGTCVVCNGSAINCPANYTYFCNCRADFVDDNCGSRRAAVIQQQLKSTTPYQTDFGNHFSAAFKNFANSVILILLRAFQSFYSSKGTDGVQVGVVVLSLVSGSTIVNTVVSLGVKAGTTAPAAFVAPNVTEMSAALSAACTGTLCSAIALDTSYSVSVANPNLCNSNLTNTCSQHATCAMGSGISYTCACRDGYRDDGSTPGNTCTQTCPASGACSGRGTCRETSGSIYNCTCNAGFSGATCQSGSHRVQQSMFLLGLLTFILPLALFRSSLA